MEEEELSVASKDFVTCLAWIKIGVPKQQPIQIKYTKEELREIIDNTRRNLSENGEQIDEIENLRENIDMLNNDDGDTEMQQQAANNEDAEIIDRYGLDNYDDSDNEQIGGFGNLVEHDSNENDPYLEENSEDENSEAEDFNLNSNDNLLLVGRVQEDASSLEVHVYNKEDNYVHHDVYLPAFPMCIESIHFNSKEQTNCNYAAIGDMSKDIGIWDIDVVNELEPLVRLKGHKDSVLDLSWNSKITNILASCSVDKTVHLWDLNINKSIHKLKRFNERVQSIQFNSQDEGKLAIGDCEGKITLVDCNSLSIQNYLIASNEIEKVIWQPNSIFNFIASTDKGTINLFDTRTKDVIKSVQANANSVTDLTFATDNLLLSACENGDIKIWELSSSNFNLIDTYKDCNVGRIFALSSNPDFPLTCAVGGDNKAKSIEVIDLSKLQSGKIFFLKIFLES